MIAPNTPANTPIIVGVGQVTDRLGAPDYRGWSNVELAAEAARRACADAGSLSRLAPRIDAIAALRTFEDSTPRYSTPFGKSNNFPQSIARRLGVVPKVAIWAPVGGDTPQAIVSELCERIAAGEITAAIAAGAEAISTAKHLIAENKNANWTETIDAPVEDRGFGIESYITAYNRRHKLLQASDCYAVLENARRARLRLSRSEYAREMGELFAPFSAVAAANPYSAAPVAYTADELITVSERNRMIAEPYTRLLVARDQVNQSAAVVIMSIEVARELGIDEGKFVYLHGYAKVTEREILSRQELGSSEAARMACRAALAAARIRLDELEFLDLYSCFPIAVFNVCDGLGISPTDRRGLTVTGGLPYFGGPGNSYSMHAIATIVEKLRANRRSYGLVGANGGYMSKYAAGIYSTQPRGFAKCDSKPLQSQIDAWRAPPVAVEAKGAGTIESYTIVYGKAGPTHSIVVGRLASDGARFLANTREGDVETLHAMIESDPLHAEVDVHSSREGNRFSL